MRRVVVNTSLSLDGVMQAPRRPDEDLRGGFTRGGWTLPYADPVMIRVMGEGMANSGPLLFGRRTYQDFYSVWPKRIGNPITEVLNNSQKYVASTTLEEPLPWANSTLLQGDAADAVAALKAQPGKDLVVLGSGEFVRSLMRRDLVDVYVLLIYPVLLGSGRRLFADEGALTSLRLTDTVTTTTGVIIATYEPTDVARSIGDAGETSDLAFSGSHK
jgi:dihydrofolate reductase